MHYTAKEVKKLISRQQEKYGWEFVFLGANIDAAETAESLGIGRETAVDYLSDSDGSTVLYEAMSRAVCGIRKGVKLAKSAEWRAEIDNDYNRRK